MKKTILFVILGIILLHPAFSQANFSGTADIAFAGNIPGLGGYESLLNPGNAFAIKDVSVMPSLIAKLDAGDEKTTFSAWFSMKKFVDALGTELFSFDLMRLSANVYLTDNSSLEIGRQSMMTGYGYGWNPIDFANPLKNPADPDAELRGVDGIVIRTYPGDALSLKLYALLSQEPLSSGLDYEEIKAGAEAVLYLPGLELKLAGFWDYDSTEGTDAYAPAAGAALILDLFGMGVYSEAAVRKGSRNYFTDGGAGITRKTDWLFSGLAGIEYTFESELYAVIEYFYNGEGYNSSERSDFEETLNSLLPGGLTLDHVNSYGPGYFAQHYILLNLMQPFYDINTIFNLAALYSPDSGSLTLMPSINHSFSGNFSVNASYMGMLNLKRSDFNENSAVPVKHVISTVFSYSY